MPKQYAVYLSKGEIELITHCLNLRANLALDDISTGSQEIRNIPTHLPMCIKDELEDKLNKIRLVRKNCIILGGNLGEFLKLPN